MKRYYGQKNKSLGIIAILTIVGAVSLNSALCLAEDNISTDPNQEVPVQFTFNPVIRFETASTNLEISELIPGGATKSKNPTKLTVSTNNAAGYYISVGAVGHDTLDRNGDADSDFKINSVPASENVTLGNVSKLPSNTWGIACAKEESQLDNSRILGLSASSESPTKDEADLMQKALDVNGPSVGEGSVYCSIGVRAGNTLPTGKYTGKVKFYAVAR